MADNVDINENRENEQPNSAKKRRYTPSKWKRNEIKTAKTAGNLITIQPMAISKLLPTFLKLAICLVSVM